MDGLDLTCLQLWLIWVTSSTSKFPSLELRHCAYKINAEEVLPLAVTANRLGADPKATSTGVVVMLCFMKPMFLALTSVSLKSLMTLSSQAVANAEPSALKASPPTLSVCPCSSMLIKSFFSNE